MKRWGLTLGSFICCGLVAVGMLLQLTVGPVRWDAMAWPANIIVLAVLLLGIISMHLLRKKVRLFRWMATLQAGIPAMVACAMLTVLMGVTRQIPSGHQPMEPIVSRSAPPAMLPSAVPARQVTQEKNAI